MGFEVPPRVERTDSVLEPIRQRRCKTLIYLGFFCLRFSGSLQSYFNGPAIGQSLFHRKGIFRLQKAESSRDH
jgi:hypothetical protein